MHHTTTKAPSPNLDEGQLRLSLTGERVTDQDIVRLGMIQCEEGLVRMAHALGARDDSGWKQGAHDWRSSAEMLGFRRVAGLLYDAEHTPLTTESKALAIVTLHDAVVEVRARLEEMGFSPPVVVCPPIT